jgi:hypothetical protein
VPTARVVPVGVERADEGEAARTSAVEAHRGDPEDLLGSPFDPSPCSTSRSRRNSSFKRRSSSLARVRAEAAREHLATATTMYIDMGMTYWVVEAEAEMPKLNRRIDRPRFSPHD